MTWSECTLGERGHISTVLGQIVSLAGHATGCTFSVIYFKLVFLIFTCFDSGLQTCMYVFVVQIVKETICAHHNEIFSRRDFVLVIEGIVGQLASRTTLVRVIEPVLLLFWPKSQRKMDSILTFRRLIDWIAWVAQIRRLQNVWLLKTCQHCSWATFVLIEFHGFNKNVFERLRVPMFIKLLLNVLTELPSEDTGIDSMSGPSSNSISDSDKALGDSPCIFSTFVDFFVMRKVRHSAYKTNRLRRGLIARSWLWIWWLF